MDLQPYSVILADDHPVTRLGMRTLINSLPTFFIAGEAEDGGEALELIVSQQPDIAILDVCMPTLNGISVAKQIVQSKCDTKVILMSDHLDESILEEGIALGVEGILLKNIGLNEIGTCLMQVCEGNCYVSELCREYLENSQRDNLIADVIPAAHEALTSTEKSIIRLIAQKKTTKEIADMLHNSYKTIEKHRYNICRKLNLEGHCSLLSYAIEHKEWLD